MEPKSRCTSGSGRDWNGTRSSSGAVFSATGQVCFIILSWQFDLCFSVQMAEHSLPRTVCHLSPLVSDGSAGDLAILRTQPNLLSHCKPKCQEERT